MERRAGNAARGRTLMRRRTYLRGWVVRACFLLVVAPAGAQTATGMVTVREGTMAQATELMHAAKFEEALPMFRELERGGDGSFAVKFNLALCLVATSRPDVAVPRLLELAGSSANSAAVQNLLAQAYLGAQEPRQAWAAAQESARLAPGNEKLFAYLLDSATDHGQYALGLQIATLGLTTLPESQRLHYERAVLLARLDRLEEAQPEFARAMEIAPHSDLGYLAQVQALLYAEHQTEALAVLRTAVKANHVDAEMLSLLGTVLLYLGAVPGQAEFVEARSALELAVAQRPNFSTAQLALGKVDLADGRPAEALGHLQGAQRMEPQNTAVYTNLAEAYRRTGDRAAAKQALTTLGTLLSEHATAAAGEAP